MARQWWRTRWYQEPLLVYAAQALIKPFDDCEQDDIEKLHQSFGPERVFRRQILEGFSLEGEWWGMDGSTVHASFIIYYNKSKKISCFVRESHASIDIEILRRIRKGKSVLTEWHVCTVTKDAYKVLDKYLGPIENCECKHFNKEDFDVEAFQE